MRIVIALLFLLLAACTAPHAALAAGHGSNPGCWQVGYDGWTIVCTQAGSGTCNASATGTYTGSCIVYVSNTGNDGTCTAVAQPVNPAGVSPCLTIAHAMTLLRNASSDQLLLQKGGTWTTDYFGQICVSGISPTAPILIGAYGSGARPILQTNQGGGTAIAFSQGGGGNCGTGGDYIAFIGIEWFAYLRDPNCPSACTQPDNQQGISFLNTAHWVLIEDNYFHHYRQALVFESQVKWQVIIRRNILVDQFDQSGSFAEGTFLSLVMQAVVVENLFDNNGELGQGPTAFDHNIYIDGIDNTTGNYPGPSIIVGNIFTNDASGSQFRAGGYVYNNIFAQNQYPHNFGAPVKGSGNISFKNVYLEAKNPGWGPQTVAYYNGSGIDDHKYSNGSILIQNNIITQTAFPSGGFGVDVSPGQQNTTVANNIICNWGGSPLILDEATGGILQFGSMTPGSGYTPDGTYTGVALTTLTGVGSGAHATVTINGGALVNITITQNDNTHAGNGKAYAIGDTVGIGSCCGAGSGAIAPIAKVINSITNSSNTTQGANCTGLGFPSPTNSIETYDQFVLGGPGTLADFLQQARGQSHASWNNALMANAVNIYIRAGFGQ